MSRLIDQRGGSWMFTHEFQTQVLNSFYDLLGGFFQEHSADVGIAVGQRVGHQGLVVLLYEMPSEPMDTLPEDGLSIICSNTLNPASSRTFVIEARGSSKFQGSQTRWGQVNRKDLNSAVTAAWDELAKTFEYHS